MVLPDNDSMLLNLTYVFTMSQLCTTLSEEACFNPGPCVEDADIGRYRQGYLTGGVYHDTDAHFQVEPKDWPRRYPHLPWSDATLVVGIEFPDTGQLCQWAFAGAPRSIIFRQAVRKAQMNLRRDVADVVQATGPAMWTEVLKLHIGHRYSPEDVEARGGAAYRSRASGDLVIVLPYRAFGMHPSHRGYATVPASQILVVHEFRGRWRNAQTRQRCQRRNQMQGGL